MRPRHKQLHAELEEGDRRPWPFHRNPRNGSSVVAEGTSPHLHAAVGSCRGRLRRRTGLGRSKFRSVGRQGPGAGALRALAHAQRRGRREDGCWRVIIVMRTRCIYEFGYDNLNASRRSKRRTTITQCNRTILFSKHPFHYQLQLRVPQDRIIGPVGDFDFPF